MLVKTVVKVVRDIHAGFPPRLVLKHVNVHVECRAAAAKEREVVDTRRFTLM